MESQLEHGNYHLLALLGRGGFADVYQGEHIHLQRLVAIKIFRERLDDEGMSLFLYQARLLAHLEHQRVVRIQEFTIWDGHAALIMQYAPHGTLRQRFPDGTRPSLAEVIEYTWQAATGLL